MLRKLKELFFGKSETSPYTTKKIVYTLRPSSGRLEIVRKGRVVTDHTNHFVCSSLSGGYYTVQKNQTVLMDDHTMMRLGISTTDYQVIYFVEFV